MSYGTMTYAVTDAVATITLDRSDGANALNAQMASELHDVAIRCANDSAVRAVIITGSGRMFCAGGDLREMREKGADRPAHVMRMATELHSALSRLAHIDAPVIMAVNGVAAGGGFSLALSGDYVIASEHAKFVAAYSASGLTPDGSSTYFLAKHVGLLRAKELLLTNRLLTAKEALDWGIVNKVVTGADLMAEATKLAKSFAAGPTKAYGGIKQLLSTAYSESFESQLDKETRGIAGSMRTHDGPHGLDAFLEKKAPRFEGR